MKERMIIELVADLTSWNTTKTKIKNDVAGINKEIRNSVSTSSLMTTNTKQTAKAQEQLNTKIVRMVDKIKSLNKSTFTDWAVGIHVANKALEKTKSLTQKVMDKVSNSPFVTDKSKMAAGLLKRAQSIGLTDDFSGLPSGGSGFISQAFNDAWTKLGADGAKNGRQLYKLIPTLKELGVNVDELGLSGKKAALGVNATAAATKAAAIAMGALTAAITAVAVVLPIFIAGIAAALKVSKLGDNIYHTAQRFGMGTEAFQEWSYIMEHAGGTIDDLTGFMETLASEQAAVIEGSEDAAANFKRLGLSMEEVSGMRQQELFEETVRRIQQIGDATERSAIAYSIFGDEASKFMNVLNMTNEEMERTLTNYHLLGGAMSGELLASSNSLQGSIHNMKQAWQGICNTLAEAFIPIVQAVVRWLTKAFVVVNLFLRSILGLDLKTTGAGDAMDGATSSTNKYTGAAKNATKAAEQLRRTTMGFDELNIVSNPKSSGADASVGAGGGFDTGGLNTGFEDSLLDAGSLNLEGLYAWFEKYKTLIKDITAWSLMVIGIALIVGGCFAGFNPIMIGAGIGLCGLSIPVGMGDGGTWEKLFGALKAVWDKMAPTFQPVIDFFKGAWQDIRERGIEAWTLIEDVWKHVAPFFQVLVEVIKQYFYDLQLKLELIWAVISEAVKFVVQVIASAFELCWTFIKAKWDKAIAFFQAIWDSLKLGVGIVVDVFSGKWGSAFDKVKQLLNTWVEYFKKRIEIIKDVVKGVGTFFGDVIKGALNGIIGIAEKAVNAIIKRINKLSWTVPDWVPAIGGQKWGFNFKEISIPRLAEGGIATRSTIANIGEAGTEAILPLENNTEWMDTLASKIAERNQGPSKIVLQVGEKELGWAAINGINGITKQTGNIQLAL